VTPDDEHTAFECIIQDFEMHYRNGPEMFSSRYNFNKFLNTEVRFHAKLLKVDFEKAREVVIAWVEQSHTMEYFQLI
jgi:hypothetical protein